MQRSPYPQQQDQKRKEIDFQAIDRLLEYTKSTHQNKPISQLYDSEKEKETQRQIRPNSLTQRISLYETNQQIKKERLSFQDLDFCKIVMFLMATEIERLREIINDQQNQEQIRKNFEDQDLNKSINKEYIRESECDELKEELFNIKSKNKEQVEKNAQILYQQIEELTLENQELKQNLQQLTNEIISLKQQLQQKKNQYEQSELQNKQLKEEIIKLQNISEKKYQQFIEDLNNEIENLQQNYKKLYNDYLSYKQNQSYIYEQQTQVPNSRLQSQQQQHYMSIHDNQEICMLNSMIQQLQNENTKLKDELFKQSRRSETWCC